MKLKVTVNGIPYEVQVEEEEPVTILPPVYIGGAGPGAGSAAPVAAAASGNAVVAPLAGSVLKILVKAGQQVKAGDVVAVLEAMKMETEIQTPRAGTVKAVVAKVGQAVQGGDPIVEIDAA